MNGTLFFMLGLAVLPLLAFGYGIYCGGRRDSQENLLALLIPAGLAVVYLAAPRFDPGRPGDPDPEAFLAAVFSLALTGYLLFRAFAFMLFPLRASAVAATTSPATPAASAQSAAGASDSTARSAGPLVVGSRKDRR